jgi:hypothetical protein
VRPLTRPRRHGLPSSDNRHVEAWRDGHSDGAHAHRPAGIFSSTVQLGARGEIVESARVSPISPSLPTREQSCSTARFLPWIMLRARCSSLRYPSTCCLSSSTSKCFPCRIGGFGLKPHRWRCSASHRRTLWGSKLSSVPLLAWLARESDGETFSAGSFMSTNASSSPWQGRSPGSPGRS